MKDDRKHPIAGFSGVREHWKSRGGDPFADIVRLVDGYISAGYNVVLSDGHVINKDERAARSVVEAELPCG